MNNRKYIHIGEEYINDALTSTRKLEALSCAIAVKCFFVSSSYHNPNKYEISKVLQVSTKKAQRILDDCITFGYAKKENNNLIFKHISKKEHLTYRLDIAKIANFSLNKRFIRKSDTNTRCLSLEALKNEIRTIKLLIHIQQKKFIVDTVKGFAAGSSSLAETKAMNKNIAKYAMNTNYVEQGISIDSLMKSINIKNRNKMISIIRLMMKNKLITKKRDIYCIGACNKDIYLPSNEFGCFFTYNNKLYQLNSNIYYLSEKANARIGRR